AVSRPSRYPRLSERAIAGDPAMKDCEPLSLAQSGLPLRLAAVGDRHEFASPPAPPEQGEWTPITSTARANVESRSRSSTTAPRPSLAATPARATADPSPPSQVLSWPRSSQPPR